VVAFVHSRAGGDGKGPAADSIHVRFAYSSNLEEMMASLLPSFNAAHIEVDGRPVWVDGVSASSGDVEQKIARGTLRPEAWSPASSLWGRLLNHEADRPYVADRNPSLASSPVVIGMWEPLARALGWPTKPVGFADVLRLATEKSDWAAYGKPTFGRFKLGHTNPDFSTSGLSFVAAQYYTAAGKHEGLTVADVQRPSIRAKVRAIERSIVHYGDTGSFFAEQLAAHGPGYASAVAMEETTLIEFNQERRPGSMKLVAIYPADGTFMSDNPYLVLRAPWVSATERHAAVRLGEWLRQHLTPDLVARYAYRPGDASLRPRAPVSHANGADPTQPRRLLTLPDPDVLARIKAAWREDRKPANVLLLVDVSGSMADEDKIGQARQGLQAFLRQLSPRDRVGLTSFSSDQMPLVPIAPMRRNGPLLRTRVSELIAGGDTALYDAAASAWSQVDGLRDDERINAVVILSDGADTASVGSLEGLVSRLRSRANGEGRQIRVFTIAYGKDAAADVLAKIADSSGGKAYVGEPETIAKVYLEISSFF
jgi:Ca-activated chloride channel family protein